MYESIGSGPTVAGGGVELTVDGTFIDQNTEGDGGKLNSQSELTMVMSQQID